MAHLKTRTVGGERRYDVCWREHGKNRSKTFTRRADAARFKTETERKSQLGLLYDAPAQTLVEARDEWRSRWMIGKAASTVARKDEAWLCIDALDDVFVSELSPALADDTIAAVARRAPRQAQLGLQTLKQVLRDAQQRGQRIDPRLLGLRAPTYDEREPIFLTYAESLALSAPMPASKLKRDMTRDEYAAWMPEPIRRLPLFAVLSGLRLGELLGLLDADIDLKGKSVLVQRSFTGRTKSRKRRRIELSSQAVWVLRQQLKARTPSPRGLVFASPTGRMWGPDNFRARVFRPAVKRIASEAKAARRNELERLTLHDLRHSFASLMLASGANPLEIAAALGHSDRKGQPDASLVWKRYGHLYENSGREAAQRMERYLEAVAS